MSGHSLRSIAIYRTDKLLVLPSSLYIEAVKSTGNTNNGEVFSPVLLVFNCHYQSELDELPCCMILIPTEWPQFFTATNQEWKKLLKPDKYKDIIIDSLRFLVNSKRIKLYSFVIMINHVHLIWQMHPFIDSKAVQRDFLKYTAGKIKADLAKHHQAVLEQFLINAKDRKYQFWKTDALSVEIRSQKVFLQKLEYIHWNPVRAGLCALPEDYKYSSAQFYETGIDNWGFLTHYRDRHLSCW